MTAPLSDTERRADFTNELGHDISMSVVRDDRGVTVTVEGPSSIVEQTWTPMEAERLGPMLCAADLDTLSALRREVAMLRDANEGRADEIDGLTAEVSALQRCADILDPEVTFRDLEAKVKDGKFDLWMGLGDESKPAMKFLAAVMLHAALGEGAFETEPPNYTACEMSIKPAGEFEPLRAYLEVIKPGGQTSHEIRRGLERQLEAIKETP
jgi:hypothetical protein